VVLVVSILWDRVERRSRTARVCDETAG
jgi:hypothetical protein